YFIRNRRLDVGGVKHVNAWVIRLPRVPPLALGALELAGVRPPAPRQGPDSLLTPGTPGFLPKRPTHPRGHSCPLGLVQHFVLRGSKWHQRHYSSRPSS